LIPRKLNIIIFNLLRSFAPALFNFAIAVLGVQYCGAENWGMLVSIMIVLFVFTFISNWGNKEYLIRAYAREPAMILHLFFSNLTTRAILLVFSFILFVFYPIDIALIGIALIVVRFVYSSLESLIVYHQKFKQQLLAESAGFAIVLLAIVFNKTFSVFYFLCIYLLANLIKSVMVILALKPRPEKGMIKFSKTQVLAAIPFFLIGLSGWMNSKVDLYVVDYYLPASDLLQYQILVTAFIMLQGVSAVVLYPFSKHIYRLNDVVLAKMKNRLALAGVPVVISGSIAIWFFLNSYTAIRFDTAVYLVMAIASFPPFLFMVDIYTFFKTNHEKIVMYVNFIGAILILILTIILIPIYGIFGAALGICCSKWMIFMIYKLTKNSILKSGNSVN
jgi:O-antigen/teichoic acid export membrane protein